MFYVIKQLSTVLLLPPTPWLIAILAGLALLRRRARLGRGLILFGICAVWLSCTEAAGQLLSDYVLHVPPALTATGVAALRARSEAGHDVAVLVLGGGANAVSPEYGGQPALKNWTMERLHYGVWLARRVDAPLGFTGGIGWTAQGVAVSEAALASRVAAEDFGLPLRWAEALSRDTRENARNSLPLLQAAGVHTVVIVTNGMHMPRALRDFRAQLKPGMSLVAAPISLREDGTGDLLDWCPSFHGLERVQYALYEILGLLAGH
ncbi:MAG: YdcF family protein [Pelomonas sp.]|nr:YdcF family protein [Roseateles sp.]